MTCSRSRTLFLLSALSMFFAVLPASGQGTIAVERMPLWVASGGGAGAQGSPYALFVRIQGWSACANGQAYIKLYNGSNGDEFQWTGGAWSNGAGYNSTNKPLVSLDGGGNWAGWLYAKHNDALPAAITVRAASVANTSGVRITSPASYAFTVGVTTPAGNAGWIVRGSSPAQNRIVAAYAGPAMVGAYRSEENSIAEGYGPGPGGFRIAVPAGVIDSLVTFNDDGTPGEVWRGPWVVSPGAETDAAVQGGQVGKGSALIVPSAIQGGVVQALGVRIAGAPGVVLSSVRVRFPAGWSWSRLAPDVSLTGPGTPSAALAGDTIVVTGASLGDGDSLLVHVSGITPPDSTAVATVQVWTGTAPDAVFPLAGQPGVLVFGTPIPVAQARESDASGIPLRSNTLVTVRGIVTVANQFGGPSYLQDNSGGIAVFGSSFSQNVAIGEEVIVTGLMQPFRGLAELVNPVLHARVSSGNETAPLPVTAAQVAGDGAGGLEQFEGLLVRLDGVTVGESGSGTWAYQNYQLTDRTGSVDLRIDDNTDLIGFPVPAGTFDVIGVVSQFSTAAPPAGGYQVMPRSRDDLIAAGPLFATPPEESGITSTSLTVRWSTVFPGSTFLRYGTTPALEMGVAGSPDPVTDHSVTLGGLAPATLYYLGALSVSGTDTSAAAPLIASTASPEGGTGVINVYFNKTVQASLAWYQPAAGVQDLTQRLIARLNGARRSVDLALYSLSGAPGGAIATALVAARQRGVRVRAICENDNRTSAPFTTLAVNGVPLITDAFDAVTAGAGLMHNKFFVIDARGGAPESVWVWTGSWNPTESGTNSDHQNAVEVQDQALGNAYTREFEEMWGSAGEVPDGGLSRFGARKANNTPHRFVVGGRSLECYFSPSDRTTSRIIAAINGAAHSVAVGTMTLTRSDIAAAIIARKAAGASVRVILDNNADTGTQYPALAGAGLDVRLKPAGSSFFFHHKYAVIDGERPAWGPVVITGSHNWSSAAENSNSENTLILHDGNIANQYLQEFASRYYQFGGTDTLTVGVEQAGGAPPAFGLSQNHPNPFNPVTAIHYTVPVPGRVRLAVYDLLGREVAVLVDQTMAAGTHAASFDARRLASGVYLYRLEGAGSTAVRKMTLLR